MKRQARRALFALAVGLFKRVFGRVFEAKDAREKRMQVARLAEEAEIKRAAEEIKWGRTAEGTAATRRAEASRQKQQEQLAKKNEEWNVVIRRLLMSGGLILVGFLIYTGVGNYFSRIGSERDQKAVFVPHRQRYTAGFPDAPEGLSRPYINGKIVPIIKGHFYANYDEGWFGGGLNGCEDCEGLIDDIYFELPVNLRARTPDEVGTVVLLEWHGHATARYTMGGSANQITCVVSVIDLERKVVVGSGRFGGSIPEAPSSKSANEQIYGSVPKAALLEYIKQIPRKQ